MVDVKTISKILNKYDPKGLIAMGGPKNEYDAEAEFISKNVSADLSESDIYKIVKKHFIDRFDGITIFERFTLKKVAKELYRATHNTNLA